MDQTTPNAAPVAAPPKKEKAQRVPSCPLTLTLEYLDDGKDATGKDTGLRATHSIDLKLVLPGVGWSLPAIEAGLELNGEIIARGGAEGAMTPGGFAGGVVAGMGAPMALSRVLALYYIGVNEKIHFLSTIPERVQMFQAAILPFTSEQMEELIADFLEFYRPWRASILTSLAKQ